MSNNEIVSGIVGTYNLPPRLQGTITRIATRQLEERGLLSVKEISIDEQRRYFSQIYRHIDELVEKFQFPFKEIYMLRLDSLINPDSRHSFHDIIGFYDSNRHRDEITVSEAIELLRGRIDDSALKLILKLSSYNGTGSHVFGLSPEYIIANADKIQQRLDILAKKAEQDGSIVLPRRPVVYVQFGGVGKVPFYIRFGHRKYNGNPIVFFRENFDVYKDRSRWGLAQFDKPLYEALRWHGQLDDAIQIPSIQALPKEEVIRIINAYKPSRGILNKASKITGHHPSVVRKYWQENGLETKGKWKQSLTQEQKYEVITIYQTVDGNASEAARLLGYAHSTVWKNWTAAGLKPRGKSGHKRFNKLNDL